MTEHMGAAPHSAGTGKYGAVDGESIPAVHPTLGFLGAAIWYAARGFSVMPLAPGSNRSHYGLGKDYTKTPGPRFIGKTDLAHVAAWWTQWPGANIGVITGMVSRLVVIDCDGPSGVETFHEWCYFHDVSLGGVPYETTPTRGGGRHYFFGLGHPLRSGDWLDGVEVKADGFHVAVAPSVRRVLLSNDFKAPKNEIAEVYIQYEMVGDPRQRLAMPDAIETAFRAGGGRSVEGRSWSSQMSLEPVERYLETGFPLGARNNTCVSLARSLLNKTHGDTATVTAIVRAIWERTSDLGTFPWKEAEKCVRQAHRYWRNDLAALPTWRG